MSAIHDLIQQIDDPRLRERLHREWTAAAREKKFGLVFEEHLPELLPLYGVQPRRGDLVCQKNGPLQEIWRVRRISEGVAACVKPGDEANRSAVNFAVSDLLVVRQFGEPIFPALTPVDAIAHGPADAPWHTLIEADNYHALQLLDYLYGGQVDCIYIDPPYNTGARDWKYNNDYVDGNDSWRHSKWLAFMDRRIRLAKRLLRPDNSMLIKLFDALKARVTELLGPLTVSEDEKRPLAAGFAANLAYFKLDFLDRDRVALQRAFREILPLLWLKAGATGPRSEWSPGTEEPPLFIPASNNFAVLLNESRLAELLRQLQGRTGLSHLFLVTDAEESFKAMAGEALRALGPANPGIQAVQLYRDYLANFTINRGLDHGATAQGSLP